MRLRRLEQQQAEHERRLSALEKMHSLMYVAQFYHRALLDPENEAYEYWLAQGMHAETIDRYALGYCSRCPTDHDRRASYTIPVIIGGKLYNIRHRLVHAEGGDKYRPHMPGLPTVLFNADHLREAPPDRILITEGEKKSIIADQLGFPNVGLMGKSGFDERWVEKFQRFRVVCVLLDPDATEDAIAIARLFEKRGRVVSLYDKLDDLVVRWKATATDLEWYIRRARLV
jgi:DNA primase